MAPTVLGFPGGSEVKVCACNAGDLSSIPGLGRSPGGGTGNPFQYSCLENSMDGGAWWATVHRVTKTQTPLRDLTFTFHLQFYVKQRRNKQINKTLLGHRRILLYTNVYWLLWQSYVQCPLQGTQVQSLIREIGSYMPCSQKKKGKKRKMFIELLSL